MNKKMILLLVIVTAACVIGLGIGHSLGRGETKAPFPETIKPNTSVPVKVQPLTIYGPWEDERFRIEQHRDATSEYKMTITSIFDKVLQREVVIVGWLSAPVITSVYDLPRQQPPAPTPKVEAPQAEKKEEAKK